MKVKSILALILGLGSIAAAVVTVDYLQPQPAVFEEQKLAHSPVSIIEVTPTQRESVLTLLATTSARWPVQLKATSGAQLIWIKENLESGMMVKKGDVLAKLDTSALESSVAEAKSHLSQAQLSLKQALHEQTVAVKMLSSKTSSPFARREPQVAAAKAELERATKSLRSAEKLLNESNIVAPFDAIVTRRLVSPREWVEASQILFELAASDSVDITLPVSEFHWQKVQAAMVKPKVQVIDRAGEHWNAQLRYISPQVDLTTRQRQVVFSVDDPYQGNKKLLPNQQVKVQVSLGQQPNIAKLPFSALTRDGFVWSVDEHNTLQKEWVTLVDQGKSHIHVRFDHRPDLTRYIVAYPLLSMIGGKSVLPTVHTELTAKLREEQ